MTERVSMPAERSARSPGRSPAEGERFRLLLESIDAIVWERELSTGRLTYISSRAADVLGYPVEWWYREPEFWAEQVVHPEDRAAAVPARLAALRHGEDHELSYRALTADGRTLWLRDLARVVQGEGDEPRYLSGVMVDITARKETETASAAIVRREEAILESAGEGIYGLDARGYTTFVNPAAERMLGWGAAELIGKPQHEAIHHHRPEGTPYPVEECPIYSTLRDGKVHRVAEDVFWRRDGSCVPVAYTSTPILEGGRVTGAVITFRDVTEERKHERAIRHSEEQLLEAQRLAHIGSWEWDVASGNVFWSDELYRIFGLERDAAVGGFEGYLSRVHEEDRERVKGAIEEASRAAKPFDFDDRILRPDGSVRELRTRGDVVTDRAGRVVRLVGTCQDVTEQKAAAARELALDREHEARLRAEEARQRTEFLAEAAALLSSSLDYERTLHNLAYLAVPRLADWCVIDVVEGGQVRRLVMANPDPEKEALARELAERYPPDENSPSPVRQVLLTGKAVVVEEVTDEQLTAITRDAGHRRLASELNLRSYLSVPLTAGGEVLGAFTFIGAESGRRYAESDVSLAQELADRAALAIANARLYRTAEESREQVTRVLESITDAFFALDARWCFTYVNLQAERLLLRPRDELLGKSIWEEFPESVGSPFERGYRQAVEERKTVQFEAYYPPLEAWFDVHVYPAAGDGLSVYFRDVSDRLAAREAVQRSEQRFRSLIKATTAIVWTTSAAGEFEHPQAEWSEFTGQSWEEARGWGWRDAVHPDDREETVEVWREALAIGSIYMMEHRIRRHDGEYRTMQARAVPVLEANGEIREWVGVHTDISAQKRTEEEREAAVAIRNRFYAAMSHELRTPINAVLGYTDLILVGAYGPLNEKQTAGIERTNRAAKHLLELVNDVLDLSKLEAGKLEVDVEAVEMPALVDDLFATVQPLAEARGSALQLSRDGWRRAIRTDPRRVRQILLNLLSNAIKFGGGRPVEVICSQRDDGWAVVEVVDHGEGIAPENLARIFEEFVQVGEEKGGTGLGLPISKRLAELLGGRLEVSSTVGEGSTFRLVHPPAAPTQGAE